MIKLQSHSYGICSVRVIGNFYVWVYAMSIGDGSGLQVRALGMGRVVGGGQGNWVWVGGWVYCSIWVSILCNICLLYCVEENTCILLCNKSTESPSCVSCV